MKLAYTILPEPLHPIADLAITYFVKRRGVPAKTIKVEMPIHDDVPYRPTFTAKTRDNHIVCVDVAESAYNNALNDLVLRCRDLSLPVRLYMAIPKNTKDADYSQKLKTARSRGVGIVELDNNSADVIQEALPLSLAGVRPIIVEDFPAKLRENLTRAETIFRNGSPDKACALLFDEIESLCRAIAKKTYASSCWTQSVGFKFDSGAWAQLMDLMRDHLDAKKAKCPGFSSALIARIHGITPHRNESGHKPKDFNALVKRDRELRTRFESAVDLLADLIDAVKPLRLP